ncbi:MurR/RpiR family transcriptional regulator [Streptomyces mexicanus]|jgi:DNA-binding MurR/RpiR family transcriptional regulator|uniref:MurR/RpiR family transcriptional regulator n=1 Tax=Streptomyces mexicanus TaxID=178566 RepID=A0A7X1I1E2_9ACTN|nr:MurR/RpiR family transcriptional regulator [Streptomyces mexicanus]MBC2866926.1 MurR/RpiR family transcriptional regulator [Streptomyces mexicanus]
MHTTVGAGDGGIVGRIRELLPELPEAQRTTAESILDDPAAAARMTILDLADACGVSTGSITRLCRTLGLPGYSALRLALASDTGRSGQETWQANIGRDISEKDDIRLVASAISAGVRHAVGATLAAIDLDAVEQAASAIARARRVEICGTGGSASMGAEFQQRVYRIGVPAWSWSDTQVALTGAALLGPDDVLLALSHSGRTREVTDLAAEAASRGATTVAVVGDLDSPLARRVDLVLATTVPDDGPGHHTVLSRHAQMAVLDLLYIAVAQRTYDQSTEAMAATSEAVRPYKHD